LEPIIAGKRASGQAGKRSDRAMIFGWMAWFSVA
jgi:hypothetical protein